MSDKAAREEAERQYPFTDAVVGESEESVIAGWQGGFVAGAAWQAAQPVTVTEAQVDDARDLADTAMAPDERAWCALFLRALGITVEAETRG